MVHPEHPFPADSHDAGKYGERAEIYLRLLAESALRPEAVRDPDWVRRAAEILVEAGVLADDLAALILADLQLALRVRSRPWMRDMTSELRQSPVFLPGQPHGQPRHWRLLPAEAAIPGFGPMAIVIIANQALVPATLYFSPDACSPPSLVPPFGNLAVTDDLGTSYRLEFLDSGWVGSAWTGTIVFLPAPPAAAGWLSIIGPNGPLFHVNITGAPHGGLTPGLVEPTAESPGERLVTRRAEAMLAALALGHAPGRIQYSLPEVMATLEGAGALSPLSPAPARIAALGQLLGLPTHGPADKVPARWMDVLAFYGRRRRQAPLTGTAAIAAELPEIDGARVLIAGLRSGGSGTFLHVLAAGMRAMSWRRAPNPPWDAGISWWFRDDAGGWHLGVVEDVHPISGPEGLIRLTLLPPLGHATATLTAEITGSARRITASLPVYW